MRNAKVLIARYKKGIITKEQVLNYVKIVYTSVYDKDAVEYIMNNL